METGTESASRVSCLDAVRRALALSTPFLVAEPTCLAGQLVGRLAGGDEPAIRRLLDDVRQSAQRPWLCPVTPALTPPGPLDRYLLGHSGGVTAVAVTADGSHIVSGDSNGKVLVWDMASGRLERTLKGYPCAVGSIAVTPDGTRIVSSGSVQTMRIWDLATGKLEGTLKGHTDPVSAVAVTPDGTRAVSSGDDVRVWDLASGKVERRLNGRTGRTLVLTPDGRRAILGASEVWDLTTGTLERTLAGHGGRVAGVAVTPDGRQIVTGGEDGEVRVWDLASGTLEHVLAGQGGTVRAVAVTADGKRIVSGSPNGALRIWDITSGRLERTIAGHIGAVMSVAATPDGRRIVSGGQDGTVRVWDLEMAEWGHIPEGHSERVNAVVSTPDGSHVISGSHDGVVRIWDFASGTARRALKGHTERVRAVAVTSDGRRVLSDGDDGELRCWDLASGRLEHLEPTRAAFAVATTQDGRHMVLSCKNDGYCDGLSVLDLGSWKTERTLRGSVGETFGLAITADGTRIVSASQDGVVRVWDLASGTLEQSIGSVRQLVKRAGGLEFDGTAVGAVAVTPDGTLIVSGSDDGKLQVFNLRDGTLKRRLKAHSKPVRTVAVTPDGRRIISGGDDRTIRIWDVETGRGVASWKTEPGIWILACCVAATDSCLIAYGDSAGRVNVLRLLE